MDDTVNLLSGFGQMHTDEPGKEYRKPYATVTLSDIRRMVDSPPKVEKERGQWFVPSTLMTRTFPRQYADGEYWFLWADLDEEPQPVSYVKTVALDIFDLHDYEIYTSRSARADKQKGRILVPLSAPLRGDEWVYCQSIFNDKLNAVGCKPDRANERSAQLCYLPNRGEFYESHHLRSGAQFNPLVDWASEIEAKRVEMPAKRNALLKKPRSLDDADDPLIDFLEKHWTVFNIDNSGRVDIECPFSDQHTTDSGPSSTSYFPQGVGEFQQGHFRCLHSHCAHRTDQEFKEAIGYLAHGFDEIEDDAPLTMDENGVIVDDRSYEIVFAANRFESGQNAGMLKPNRETLATALQLGSRIGWFFGYDDFRAEYMVSKDGKNWRSMKDSDYTSVILELEAGALKFAQISKEILRDLVILIAEKNEFDSAQRWLYDQKWDGVPRVETFLRDFFAADDTPYTRAVSRYLWTAITGRIAEPGIKADMAPIAVGKQGARKTTLIAAMAISRETFAEIDLALSEDNLARLMRGKNIGELGEMKGVGAKQVENLKSFMSRQEEEWTPKFKEFTTRYKRRCIMVGSANEDEPLPEDDSGQRRWLPFRVRDNAKCSVEQLEAVRAQIYAEGLAMFREGGVAWADAERLAKAEHFAFEKEDPWTGALREYLFTSEMGEEAPIADEAGLKIVDIIRVGLSIPVRDITVATERRVGKCLRQLGMRKVSRGGEKFWVRG